MADRILLLVRHGQYHSDEAHASHGRLTPLGVRQTHRIARRLADHAIDAVYSSSMPRATETARVIGRSLRLEPRPSHLLREGTPMPYPLITREQRVGMADARARMERAFARYVRPTRGAERHDLLVCHGNVIRYLIRRAMGDAPSRWWQGMVMNCGLSIVVIRPDGVARLLAFNDVGHLPRRMQTFQ